jgi:uncharacterized surface protein with fasciclin (FAS1) repeats
MAIIRKWTAIQAASILCLSLGAATAAENTVMVGGAPMYPTKNIVENAVNSEAHTTLVAAVKAADLVGTLSGEGPFTVFAPENAAFAALPEGTVETLLQPENKAALTGVLTYHVVPGRLTQDQLVNLIQANNGMVELTTAAGGKLTARMNGPSNIVLMDEKGRTAHIDIYDVLQSNGVIHSIDTVLLPE